MACCASSGGARRKTTAAEPELIHLTPPHQINFIGKLFLSFPSRLAAFARGCKPRIWPKSSADNLDRYPLCSEEKLRFADTDRNGHISNAVFAVCCQTARMELLWDADRLPPPPNARFVIGRLELGFLAEMHWPGTVGVGTRVARVGRSAVVLLQALYQRA